MKIIQPYAKMVSPTDPTKPFSIEDGISLLRRIEFFGRISHRSEEAMTENSWKRFIPTVVMGHGDWSIVEHASVSVDTVVDRGITHEWVRHRFFSFTQESTRFVNYRKKMPASFVEPDFSIYEDPGAVRLAWTSGIEKAEEFYEILEGLGVAPQIARDVLPNATAARIVTTGNLRNWRHMFIMRTTKETHPKYKQVSIPLLLEFQEKIPLLFDDIVPYAKQSESMKRAR